MNDVIAALSSCVGNNILEVTGLEPAFHVSGV